jgi:hypothetical protein
MGLPVISPIKEKMIRQSRISQKVAKPKITNEIAVVMTTSRDANPGRIVKRRIRNPER